LLASIQEITSDVRYQVVPGFSKAMSALYRSAGQQIACKQATLKSMSPQLLGKLYVAAANLQRECDVELQGLTADYKDIMGTLRNYASGGRGLLLAIGLRHIGNDAWEKSIAWIYLNTAVDLLD